jgi:carbamoyltransferase
LREAHANFSEIDIVSISVNYFDVSRPFSQRRSAFPNFLGLDGYVGQILLVVPVEKALRRIIAPSAHRKISSAAIQLLRKDLPFARTLVLSPDHHTCHAYAAYLTQDQLSRDSEEHLILTHDAEGAGLCSTINVARGNEIARKVETVAGNSLASLYGAVTSLLGMRFNEDEQKVMGLAPYAPLAEKQRALSRIGEPISINNDLQFRSRFGFRASYAYLAKKLRGCRFDGVAGAVQVLTEQLASKWVSSACRRYGSRSVVVGGGLFHNVKLNLVLTRLPEVEKLFVCPSPGDESNAIGAAYIGYEYGCRTSGVPFHPQPLQDLYLGPQYSEDEIRTVIKRPEVESRFKVSRFDQISETVASLLANGKIVAWFQGRMEWGARALGNRSILANPSDVKLVAKINSQIKNRDFWMPFAPTILSHRKADYLLDEKDIDSPFMTIAYDTTDLARSDLCAALHPADFTTRPQILDKKHNQTYYSLLEKFEAETGIGGVLNTSFNMHGEPIVCSPTDALRTFERSGLECLAIGHFLVQR